MAKEELPRGQLTNIILSTLLNEDKYGYEIIDDIRQKTNDSLIVKQPSLYSCLRRMEEQNLISSYWRDSEIGGRRHYYSITDYGKKYAEKWSLDLTEFINKKTENSQQTQNTETTENNTGTILQQSSLFNISKQEPQKVDENQEPAKPQNYVQFDLFTTSPKVVEPSDDIFDCIKKLRNEADEDKSSIDKNLIDLRNEQQSKDPSPVHTEEILTSYENADYKINNQNQVKNAFWQFSKKQKSFAGNLQNNPTRFNDAQFIEEENNKNEVFIDKNENNTQKQVIKELETSINTTNISNDNQNNDAISNNEISLDNNTKYEFEEPLVHSTILYNETVEDNEPNQDDAIQFIDLSGNNDVNKNESENNVENTFNLNNDNLNIDSDLQNEINNTENTINENNIQIDNNNTNELLNDSLDIQEQPKTQLDDAILITEHPTINIPKVKKIAPTRFEHIRFDNSDNIIDKKLQEIRQEQNQNNEIEYQDNSQTITENLEFNENQNYDNDTQEDTKTDFESLKSYYNKCNIKFGTYKKQQGIKQKNNNLLKSSIMSIFILLLVIIESSLMFVYNKDAQPIWNFLYILCPLIFALLISYNYICVVNKKRSILQNIKQYIWKFTTIFSIVVLSIILLFSLNLICGIELDNISTYITSFIYLSVMLADIIIIKILDILIP